MAYTMVQSAFQQTILGWCTMALGLALGALSSSHSHGAPAQVSVIPSCTLIDTDFDLDDLMAIPLVIGHRHVAAILVTEGVVKADIGAAALARLVAEPQQRQLPVIIGATTNVPDVEIDRRWGHFLPDSRRMMHRGLGLGLPELPPNTPAGAFKGQLVQEALAPCEQVDVLMLGPYSSFVLYSPLIRQKIGQVVIMGKRDTGDVPGVPNKSSFNCGYDFVACRQVTAEQLPGLRYAFVDLPRTPHDASPRGLERQVYGPTSDMVRALAPTGLPNTLRQALMGNVPFGSLGEAVPGAEYWAIDCCLRRDGKSLMWDQMAALYLVYPELFTEVGGPGGHFETYLSPQAIRQVWTEATNRAVKIYP